MILAISLASIALIVVFAVIHGHKNAGSEKPSRGGWYGVAVMLLLLLGLWLAGNAGNESLAYGFGIALTLTPPVLLLIGIASSIGSAFRRRGKKNSQA